MRYVFGFLCVCALGVMPLVGCSETTGDGGSGGAAGDGGSGGVPCEDDVDCPDDNNACTEDYCENNGLCVYMPVECTADFNDCTAEMCDPSVGCEQTSVADGTQCAGGTCQTGVCELAGSVLPCSEQGIRNAIAAGGDEPYTFDCDGTTPVVTDGAFAINNNVILDGEGNLTVTGSSLNPFFVVEEEITAELHGFTVTGGAPLPLPSEKIGEFPAGSGILNNGTLTMTNSTVSNKPGNGIANSGTLTLTNCTVSGNRGDFFAGGIDNGGTVTMTNSTVSGNTGVFGGIGNRGTVTMTNSTVSGNVAHDPDNEAGGISNAGTLTVTNSLVDGDCSGDITSNGYNIESPGNTCGLDEAKGDQINVTEEQLNLGPLADNGGPTMTHALGLLPTRSVAVDRIPAADCVDADDAPLTEDQRGVSRPQGPTCDSGAFELEQATVTGTVTYAGSGAPAEGATVSVLGASVSTVTDAQGGFSLDVPVGSAFFQLSKEGTWGQIELETVPNTGDVRYELVEDSLVAEIEQSLMIEFSETQGVVDVIFNSPSGLGGETATLSVPYDSSLTFDAAEQPVLSDIPGGGEDLVFVGVDLTQELIVNPMGGGGVNTCDLENPGTVYPVLPKSFTRVRQVRCTPLP